VRVERVETMSDPRVADYRDVRDADLRGRDGLFMVEGRLGVRRLVEEGRFRARSLLLTPTALSALRDALEGLPDEVPVYVAEPRVLEGVVGFHLHRGALAAAWRGEGLRARDLFAAPAAGDLGLALEQLTNPDNVGGSFRNALAFGARGVLLCPRCCDPLYRKAVRVSMGGALRVPFARAAGWPGELPALRDLGWRVAALDPRGPALEADELPAAAAGAPVLLLVGTEGAGLSEAALAAADWRVRIDMAPGVDSLNAATAAGIALHALARARGRTRPASDTGGAG